MRDIAETVSWQRKTCVTSNPSTSGLRRREWPDPGPSCCRSQGASGAGAVHSSTTSSTSSSVCSDFGQALKQEQQLESSKTRVLCVPRKLVKAAQASGANRDSRGRSKASTKSSYRAGLLLFRASLLHDGPAL